MIAAFKELCDYDKSINAWENSEAGDLDFLVADSFFPSNETGVREIEYFIFSSWEGAREEDILSCMNRLSYRPATMKELLNFCSNHRRIYQDHMVLALGSTITISDEKMAGYMFGNNPNARLCRCDRDFGATQLFLAVRIE